MIQSTLRRRVNRRVLVLRRCIRHVMGRVLTCCLGKPVHYRMLPISVMTPPSGSLAGPDTPVPAVRRQKSLKVCSGRESIDSNSNLVSLKISLLGDSQIGKTSFLVKYVGDDEKAEGEPQTAGLNFMDKTLMVRDARISYSIWEVGGNLPPELVSSYYHSSEAWQIKRMPSRGPCVSIHDDRKSQDNFHGACKDSVAILFMFDLTSRCTLNSIPTWFNRARKWNQTAIPILIGTKFDDFIQLPLDLQWAIASQARAYARALNATLFFSSATYNINVNKIFKFITAKLFDLPWTVERNLTIGEPIIDF